MPSGSIRWPKAPPKPEPEKKTIRRRSVSNTSTPLDTSNITIPVAELGLPIPWLIGQERILAPNIIWYGFIRPVYHTETSISQETETDADGNTIITEVVVNNVVVDAYKAAMQFGLCLGPEVILKAIYVGKEKVWEGSVGPGYTSFEVTGNSYIAGNVRFYGGNFDQPQSLDFLGNPQLGAIDPDFLPAYRGLCYVILRDIVVTEIGDELSFEVQRRPDPLGIGSKNNIGDDINVASAMADYIASDWGGAGAGSSAIDIASFTTAANTLFDEGNGCSLYIQQENDGAEPIKILQEQADAIVYENPDTGKVEMRLVRYENITPSNVFRLNGDVVTKVNVSEWTSWVNTFNKLRVTFLSRAKDYGEDNVLGYNFQALNERIKENRVLSVDYPGVRVASLAKKLLERDLVYLGAPRYRGEYECDRQPASLLPGDGVSVILPHLGVPIYLGVVDRIQKFGLLDNKTIVAVRHLPITTGLDFGAPETGLAPDLSFNLAAPLNALIKQAPYWLARKQGMTIQSANTSNVVKSIVLPEQADDLQVSWSSWIVNVPGFADPVNVNNDIPYPTVGQLVGTINQFDAIGNGIIAAVTIDSVINISKVESSPGLSGIRNGQILMFIDDEILSFETVVNNMDGSYTLQNVHRGLLDTAPQGHADNAKVYIMNADFSYVSGGNFAQPLGYVPNWRINSNLFNQDGNPNEDFLAVAGLDTSFNRLEPPLRPHDARIETAFNGGPERTATPIEIPRGDQFTVTWKTRNRATTLVSLQGDAAENSEQDENGNFMVHRVFILDSGGTLRDCGATANDANYNSLVCVAPAATAFGLGFLFIRSESIYGNSIYRDYVPVDVVPLPYGTENKQFYYTSEDGQYFYTPEG